MTSLPNNGASRRCRGACHNLPPNEVAQAFELKVRHPGLAANDCFCFITAQAHSGILLTGDALLRRTATNTGLWVRGVLWIVDEFEAAGGCD